MSWLDKFFQGGYKNVAVAGVLLSQEATLNIVSGATVVDNPGSGRTDVTITGTGTVNVTGSGFVHITGGVMDAGASHGVAGQLAFGGATDISWAAPTGDVSLAGTAFTVTGLQGNVIPAPSGTNSMLTWSGSALAWLPMVQWPASATGPTISQAGTGPSGGAAQSITIAPQGVNATNGTAGFVVVNAPAPTGTGKRGGLQIQDNGVALWTIGMADAGYYGTTGFAGLYPGNNLSGHGTLVVNGGNTYLYGDTAVSIFSNFATQIVANASGVAFFGNGGFGGATGALSIANATTPPTSLPAGGVVLYSTAQTLGVDANGIQFPSFIAAPSISQAAPTSSVATTPLTVQAQSAFASASAGTAGGGGVRIVGGSGGTTNNGNGGGVGIFSGAPGGTGADGGIVLVFGGTSSTDAVSLVGAASSAARGTMQWSSAITPLLTQSVAGANTAGLAFTVQAQQGGTSAGANQNGGALNLSSGLVGTGGAGGHAGNLNLQLGGVTSVLLNANNSAMSPNTDLGFGLGVVNARWSSFYVSQFQFLAIAGSAPSTQTNTISRQVYDFTTNGAGLVIVATIPVPAGKSVNVFAKASGRPASAPAASHFMALAGTVANNAGAMSTLQTGGGWQLPASSDTLSMNLSGTNLLVQLTPTGSGVTVTDWQVDVEITTV